MARSRIEYRTESLSSYTGRISDNTPKTGRKLLVRGEDRLQYRIRRRTPKVTSKLHNSILTLHGGRWEAVGSSMVRNPASRRGKMMRQLEGGVYSDVEYAPYVEYDTGRYGPNPGNEGRGRYPIVPRRSKVLVFVIDGRVIFTKKVRHPGSKGKHMFARGAAFVSRQRYLHNQSRDILSQWAAHGRYVRPLGAGSLRRLRPARLTGASFINLDNIK